MDPEAKELLEKTYELEKENNHMLRRLRRAQRYAALMRVAYWFIIIGLGVGALQAPLVKPKVHLNSLKVSYQNNILPR